MIDRVLIDLVIGLLTTKDGFKGNIIFKEYLTKYPHAMPIKTKSALEKAFCFFKYIYLFGPFKKIITGEGNEFYF